MKRIGHRAHRFDAEESSIFRHEDVQEGEVVAGREHESAAVFGLFDGRFARPAEMAMIDERRDGMPGVSYILVMDDQGEIIAHTFVPAVPEEFRLMPKHAHRWYTW